MEEKKELENHVLTGNCRLNTKGTAHKHCPLVSAFISQGDNRLTILKLLDTCTKGEELVTGWQVAGARALSLLDREVGEKHGERPERSLWDWMGVRDRSGNSGLA